MSGARAACPAGQRSSPWRTSRPRAGAQRAVRPARPTHHSVAGMYVSEHDEQIRSRSISSWVAREEVTLGILGAGIDERRYACRERGTRSTPAPAARSQHARVDDFVSRSCRTPATCRVRRPARGRFARRARPGSRLPPQRRANTLDLGLDEGERVVAEEREREKRRHAAGTIRTRPMPSATEYADGPATAAARRSPRRSVRARNAPGRAGRAGSVAGIRSRRDRRASRGRRRAGERRRRR